MRIATTLEILRRGALGHDIDTIARTTHVSRGGVQKILGPSGYPDQKKVAAYREQFRAFSNRDVWAAADTVATYAAAIRVDEALVHANTLELDHQELRTLLAVAAAMLDPDIQPREALAWAETGAKRGRPKKDVA